MSPAAVLLALRKAAASIGVAALVWQLVLSLLQRWRHRRLPAGSSLPLLGHLPQISALGLPHVMAELEKNHGSVGLLWFGSTPWVILTDAELIRTMSVRYRNRSAPARWAPHDAGRGPQRSRTHPLATRRSCLLLHRRLDWPGAGLLLGEHKAMDDYGLVFAKAEEWRPARWDPHTRAKPPAWAAASSGARGRCPGIVAQPHRVSRHPALQSPSPLTTQPRPPLPCPRRRAWEPAVTHPHSLLGYCPVMNACAGKLVARLEAASEAGAEVDMWRELGRMTLAVVGTAAFGWAA
jgi:hypothetical protein